MKVYDVTYYRKSSGMKLSDMDSGIAWQRKWKPLKDTVRCVKNTNWDGEVTWIDSDGTVMDSKPANIRD